MNGLNLDNYLSQPYKESSSKKWKAIAVISVGLFIFLFLYIFKPSPYIYEQEPPLQIIISFGFGLLTSFVLFLFKFILEPIVINEKWTLGKSILWGIFISACIGIATFFLVVLLFENNYEIQYLHIYVKYFVYSILGTIFIGAIPISIRHLITYNLKYKKALKEAGLFDIEISEWNEDIILTSGNSKKHVFDPGKIVYFTSMDNYVTIVTINNNSLVKTHIRRTLKELESELQKNKDFIRCHKSFIVNLKYVKKTMGNTQNLKLTLTCDNLRIPVSRSKAEAILQKVNKK